MRTPLNAIVGWISILRHQYAEASHFQEGLAVIERNTKAQVQLIDDSWTYRALCRANCALRSSPAISPRSSTPVSASCARRLNRGASRSTCAWIRRQQTRWPMDPAPTGRVEPGVQRGEVHAQGRAGGRHVGSRPVERSDSGERYRARHQCRPAALRLRPLPPSGQQYATEGRRAWAWGCRSSSTSSKRTEGRSKPPAQGEGHGSTFTVRLPIPPCGFERSGTTKRGGRPGARLNLPDAVDDAERPPVRLDGVHVLVVDDEADARQVLAMMLERVGAVVTTADSARAAIEALANGAPRRPSQRHRDAGPGRLRPDSAVAGRWA